MVILSYTPMIVDIVIVTSGRVYSWDDDHGQWLSKNGFPLPHKEVIKSASRIWKKGLPLGTIWKKQWYCLEAVSMLIC